jgi:hypothetical protein
MLGSSASMAGLTLVFLGVVISTYRSFDADSSPRVLGRYRRSAMFVLGSFALSLITVVLAISWLAWSHPIRGLFWVIFATFLLEVAVLFGTAVFVSLQVLWR